eukprot:7000889-Pyramimonas_sp.AAC.1
MGYPWPVRRLAGPPKTVPTEGQATLSNSRKSCPGAICAHGPGSSGTCYTWRAARLASILRHE